MEEEFRKIKDPEIEKWLNDHIILNKQFIDEARALKIKPLTNEFWVYHQHRSYEKFGNFGFCVAGIPQMAKDCGLTDKQVLSAYRQLMDKGAIQHIWCDSKVYRNKTKVYVSQALIDERKIALTEKSLARTTRQKLAEGDEPIQLDQSGKSEYQSGKSEYQSGKSDLNNYNKQLKRKKRSISGSDEPSSTHSPFSFAVSKDEPAVAPDGAPAQPVVDIRKISASRETHVDGKVVSQLLKAGGKKDVVTSALVSLVRKQAKKYGGVDKLFEMVKRVKFEPFYAKMGMMSLLADKNLSNIMNMDNEVHEPIKKDWRYYQKLDRFDPERIKFFKEHPEYML